MADSAIPEWRVQGELALNCNCKVFCPCVVSLGEHPPTDGRCFAWSAVHIDTGHWADTALDGLNIAWMLDIPGRMSEGGWSAALYVDDQASDEQAAGLEQIFSGAAQGTTGLLSLVVAEFLGSKKCPITYVRDGKTRQITIPKIIDAQIEAVPGANKDENLVVTNSQYWMGPNITVARGGKSRFKDYGRVWRFDGLSAEMVDIDWKGPGR